MKVQIADQRELSPTRLRSVWGAALHDLDDEAYRRVFTDQDQPVYAHRAGQRPREASSPNEAQTHQEAKQAASPLQSQITHQAATDPQTQSNNALPDTPPAAYIIRQPDPAKPEWFEWILFGDAIEFDQTLLRAWDIASGMGLGRMRHRFSLLSMAAILPNYTMTEQAVNWTLDRCVDPDLIDDFLHRPCQLRFPDTIRLMRRLPGQPKPSLIREPDFPDLVVGLCRRINLLLPAARRPSWEPIAAQCLDLARQTPATPWKGTTRTLHRYSARQQQEISLRGVAGTIQLPEGPGPLLPLICAGAWTHLGKAVTMGLGRMLIGPVEQSR